MNQASLDAIHKVTVQTSNYAAEYGQAGGGYFNYTMKSGTNAFNGSGYDYFVNEILNTLSRPTCSSITLNGNKYLFNDHILNRHKNHLGRRVQPYTGFIWIYPIEITWICLHHYPTRGQAPNPPNHNKPSQSFSLWILEHTPSIWSQQHENIAENIQSQTLGCHALH